MSVLHASVCEDVVVACCTICELSPTLSMYRDFCAENEAKVGGIHPTVKSDV
jgi:hypothetical protein